MSETPSWEEVKRQQREGEAKAHEENRGKAEEHAKRERKRESRRNGQQRGKFGGDDATPLQVPLTEDGIALAFAERHRDELRYDHTRGKWYHWDGARWKLEDTELAFDWARIICREYNKANQSTALPKLRTASAVEKFAQADRRFAVTHEQWDADP